MKFKILKIKGQLCEAKTASHVAALATIAMASKSAFFFKEESQTVPTSQSHPYGEMRGTRSDFWVEVQLGREMDGFPQGD